MAIKVNREVVLPRAVANAEVKILRGVGAARLSEAQTTYYVNDQGIRDLGNVRATDGSMVNLSSFDGMEVVGKRDPRMQLPGGVYTIPAVWSDRDASTVREGYDTADALNSYRYGGAKDGWDAHVATSAIAMEPSYYNRLGEAPYLLMRLGDGEIVRGWLTSEGNVSDPNAPR